MLFKLSQLRALSLVLLCLLCGQAGASSNETQAAAHYAEAQSLIASASYADALSVLRTIQADHPAYSNISAVQSRIAVLHDYRDAADVMPVFMQALDERDNFQSEQAVKTLSSLVAFDGDAPLADDALYLKAYIEVMDLYRFDDAQVTLSQLRKRFPDTAYIDSADYLYAIALEQSGQTYKAVLALRFLRDKHTAFSLPFGYRWPSSNMLSRYWFDRADRRLAVLQQSRDTAAKLRNTEQLDSGAVVMQVEAQGREYSLTLLPSPVVKNAQWVGDNLQPSVPPEVAVYSGYVNDEPDSWARVVVNSQSVSGMLSINGERLRLQPDQLIGTISYYKTGIQGREGRAAAQPDHLHAPETFKPTQTKARTQNTSTRLVSLSLVVDSAFNNFYGGQGVVQALNNINMADGIYYEQGLAFVVDKVQILDDDNAAVVTGDDGTLESLLVAFRQYRLDQKPMYSDSSLVYLFTAAPTVDKTLGLAWIDTLCRFDGYDVGVTTPSSYADILTAHELGHSFGATHDNETACQNDRRKIMWPSISSITEPVFSSCSEEQVVRTQSKSCLGNTIDAQLSAELTQDAMTLKIRNKDAYQPVTARINIDTAGLAIEWPAGCNEQTPGSAVCVVDSLQGADSKLLKLVSVDGSALTAGRAIASVELDDMHDHEPNNNTVVIDVTSGVVSQQIPFVDTESPGKPRVEKETGFGGIRFITLLMFVFITIVRRRKQAV